MSPPRHRRPAVLGAILASGLVLASLGAPAAAAGEGEEQLWRCDHTPAEVLLGIVRNVPGFVNALLSQTARAAGKGKCSSLMMLGVCSDESLPATSPVYAYSTGGFSASPHVHPHRELCYEYFFVHPTCGDWTILTPDPASPHCVQPTGATCPWGTKREHRTAPGGGDHRHRCVLLNEGLPLPYS